MFEVYSIADSSIVGVTCFSSLDIQYITIEVVASVLVIFRDTIKYPESSELVRAIPERQRFFPKFGQELQQVDFIGAPPKPQKSVGLALLGCSSSEPVGRDGEPTSHQQFKSACVVLFE